jgi:hypothetical protein
MTNSQRMRLKAVMDLFYHPVGKIFLLRVAPDIGERQYRDRGLVGENDRRFRHVHGCRRLGIDDRGGGFLLLAHGTDEANTLARQGTDQALGLAAVAQHLAHRADPTGKGRFGDDPAAPDCRQEVVLADPAVTVLHQIDPEVEDLRLKRYSSAPRRSSRRSRSSR